jgi:hypothetical protein
MTGNALIAAAVVAAIAVGLLGYTHIGRAGFPAACSSSDCSGD